MARIKGAMMTRKRRNKVLKAAKGYWGAKSKHFKMAKQAVMKQLIEDCWSSNPQCRPPFDVIVQQLCC